MERGTDLICVDKEGFRPIIRHVAGLHYSSRRGRSSAVLAKERI
jgi:hypothetical protein